MWMKKGKENFKKSVRDSLDSVTIDIARRFAAKARRYMLAYQYFDNLEQQQSGEETGNPVASEKVHVNYEEIENFVRKKAKNHRSSADQDTGYIAKIWREAQGISG
jgi:hypothetical protein